MNNKAHKEKPEQLWLYRPDIIAASIPPLPGVQIIDTWNEMLSIIDKARSARYTQEEVFNTEFVTTEFVNATFDRESDLYVIKPDLRRSVHFDVADALSPELGERLEAADIVYAQHFLIHLKRHQAITAFNNICRLLNPRAALFIAGIEHDMLINLTRRNNLVPLAYKVEEIHKEVGVYGKGWPYVYWGCEPFLTVRKDWQRRYCTVFLKS